MATYLLLLGCPYMGDPSGEPYPHCTHTGSTTLDRTSGSAQGLVGDVNPRVPEPPWVSTFPYPRRGCASFTYPETAIPRMPPHFSPWKGSKCNWSMGVQTPCPHKNPSNSRSTKSPGIQVDMAGGALYPGIVTCDAPWMAKAL